MEAASDYALPALYALFVWWFSTGFILYLDGLPRSTYRWSLAAATIVAIAAFVGLAQSSMETTRAGAYVAFTSAILVWGWNEMAFLMGFVTGSRRTPCAPGCGGLRHFWHGAETVLHHEIALVVSGACVLAATWGGPNQVGAWTFVALWGMRLSTKLNVFLGVPNVTEEFLPEHLAYLKHFFRRRAMNPLFPLSVTIGTAIVVLVAQAAFDPAATAFEAVGHCFLAALLALALLEHWFLVLPLPAASLWRWGLRSHEATERSRSRIAVLTHRRSDQPRPVLEQKVAEGGCDR